MQLKQADWHAAFGRALVRLRKQRGVSQEGMARAVGLARHHASDLELGKTTPRLDTLLVLAQFLNLTFGEFAQEIEKEYGRMKRGAKKRPLGQ